MNNVHSTGFAGEVPFGFEVDHVTNSSISSRPRKNNPYHPTPRSNTSTAAESSSTKAESKPETKPETKPNPTAAITPSTAQAAASATPLERVTKKAQEVRRLCGETRVSMLVDCELCFYFRYGQHLGSLLYLLTTLR